MGYSPSLPYSSSLRKYRSTTRGGGLAPRYCRGEGLPCHISYGDLPFEPDNDDSQPRGSGHYQVKRENKSQAKAQERFYIGPAPNYPRGPAIAFACVEMTDSKALDQARAYGVGIVS